MWSHVHLSFVDRLKMACCSRNLMDGLHLCAWSFVKSNTLWFSPEKNPKSFLNTFKEINTLHYSFQRSIDNY